MAFRLTMSPMDPLVGAEAMLPQWSVAPLGSKSLVIQICTMDPTPSAAGSINNAPTMDGLLECSAVCAAGVILVLSYTPQKPLHWEPQLPSDYYVAPMTVETSPLPEAAITSPLPPASGGLSLVPSRCVSRAHSLKLNRHSARTISHRKRRREEEDVDGGCMFAWIFTSCKRIKKARKSL